jgi:hypothetical protein
MRLPANSVQFFSAQLTSSADVISFTVNSLDSGTVNMYVQQYNLTYYASQTSASIGSTGALLLPDPHNSNSYMATTANQQTNILTLSGPHAVATVFVLAVVALSDVRFTVVAITSQQPVILQVFYSVHCIS